MGPGLNTVKKLRLRYVAGLSAIALLVTASFITMQRVVSEQREFASLVNLSSHQAGLANRIAYFASLMAATDDETEFNMARSQVGRTINKMKASYDVLRNGDPEKGIPCVSNQKLKVIYDAPMVGLGQALTSFLEKAGNIYESDLETFSTGSSSYLFLTTYGPHVLEPLLDAAVDEYEQIGREAILQIERLEIGIWLATIFTLLFEIGFIFRPFEKHVERTLRSLHSSIKELQLTKQRLVSAQKLALVGDWEINLKERTISCSDMIYSIGDLDRERFTLCIGSALKMIHVDDRRRVRECVIGLIRNGGSKSLEYRIVRPDGSERLVFQYATANRDRILGTVQDITERKELSTRLEKLSGHIPGFLFQMHLDKRWRSLFPFVSKGVLDATGINMEKLGKSTKAMFELIHEDDRARIKMSVYNSSQSLATWHDHFRILHPEKGYIWLEGHATPERIADGETIWYGYICDITERKYAEEKIRKLALYDPLTGLANRRLLLNRLVHAIATSRRNENYGAVLMLDLDNFKILNDTKGHDVGDELLIEVAHRIKSCVRETDTVSRLGGDEFVVILEWLGSKKRKGHTRAMDVAEKIRVALGRPYVLCDGKHVHHGSSSIGVATFKGNARNESELLKRADVAMYAAKDLGKNRICNYTISRQKAINQRSVLSQDLQRAVENEEFLLHFQPQLTETGKVYGAEALIRWQLPDGQLVMPGDFIIAAESNGLILPIGDWVLANACDIIDDLSTEPFAENISLSINISARQFNDERFIEKVKRVLEKKDIDARKLRFELTESSFIQNIEKARELLLTLNVMGISIELDDFGTGYSSLNSLNQLPLHGLKIDQSLTRTIEDNTSGLSIIRAAIAMAKALSLDIIVEGVETETQNNILIREGCDKLQGYYHARPMPFDEFKNYLMEKHMEHAKIFTDG